MRRPLDLVLLDLCANCLRDCKTYGIKGSVMSACKEYTPVKKEGKK